MKIDVCAVSHKGKIRERNEDNLYLSNGGVCSISEPLFITKTTSTDRRQIFAVFDGMGGLSEGDRASFLAASTTKSVFESQTVSLPAPALMKQICLQSNAALCREMQGESKKRIGATIAMMLFEGDSFCLCNIGDSPILMEKDGETYQLSVDHNEREMFIRLNGGLPDAGKKFKLTQHLGIFPEEMELEPYIAQGRLSGGETFILCSDGLTDMVPLTKINEIVKTDAPSERIAKRLLQAALDNGGRDNVTVVCVKVQKPRFGAIFR